MDTSVVPLTQRTVADTDADGVEIRCPDASTEPLAARTTVSAAGAVASPLARALAAASDSDVAAGYRDGLLPAELRDDAHSDVRHVYDLQPLQKPHRSIEPPRIGVRATN